MLTKALPIFDCLTFHTVILGTPNWPSVSKDNLTLFLLKLYLSNTFIYISAVSRYFALSPDSMLLIGAKILFNTDSSKEDTNKILDLQNAVVDINDALQHSFIFETLIQFDQILRTTSIDIWCHKKEKNQASFSCCRQSPPHLTQRQLSPKLQKPSTIHKKKIHILNYESPILKKAFSNKNKKQTN
jgi:hypothetical protein